ncbi:MAG: MFS transporter [Dehalococcoidales bacterium]|nr:MFS transporter [Dehalococcoidales bacterium]
MRRFLVYAAAGLSLLFISISGTAVAVAFPQIIADYDTSLVLASWVLSIAQIANTVAMPLTGKACDIYGRKFIFIFCTLLFTAGSLASALAPSIELLIFFRLVQGIGAGGFLPAATSIVAEEFPNTRQQSIGFFSSIFPLGQIMGPNLGGWLTESFGWRSTFWLSVPLGLIVLIAAIPLLRKTPPHERGRLDLSGAGMLAAFISALMIGISLMSSTGGGISWWPVALSFTIAIVILLIFLRRQGKVENPIIDFLVLRERHFMATNMYNFFYGMGVLGVFGFIPLYAVSVYNMSTLDSGLILTPRSIAMVIASVVVSLNLVRWGYRWPIFLGTILTSISLIVLAWEPSNVSLAGFQISGITLIIIALLLAGLSQGMIAPASNNACIELMPERIGTITGVRGMFRQTGGAICVGLTALVVQSSGDSALGFRYVFIGLTAIMLLVMPVILLIPSGKNRK